MGEISGSNSYSMKIDPTRSLMRRRYPTRISAFSPSYANKAGYDFNSPMFCVPSVSQIFPVGPPQYARRIGLDHIRRRENPMRRAARLLGSYTNSFSGHRLGDRKLYSGKRSRLAQISHTNCRPQPLTCFFSTLAHASFSATVRLNTGFPAFESGSAQKYPSRSN